MSELKPCPFCGGTQTRPEQVEAAAGALFEVLCGNCGACGPLKETLGQGIDAWNTRAEK